MFSNILGDIETVHRSKATKSQTRMLKVFKTSSKFFIKFSTGDKTSHDKASDEGADDKQQDSADMPDL